MSDSKSEPITSQISTLELRRLLNDQMRKDVSEAMWQRITSKFLRIGVPSIILLLGAAGATIASLIRDTARPTVERIERDARELAARNQDRLQESLRAASAQFEARVPSLVSAEFVKQSGQALTTQLQAATRDPVFQTHLMERLDEQLASVMAARYDSLSEQFTQRLIADAKLQEQLSRRISGALVSDGSIRGIIAEALTRSVRDARPDDSGRMSALALLAALDQPRANSTVLELLQRADQNQLHEIALDGLAYVSFRGRQEQPEQAGAMLQKALQVWTARCMTVACAVDDEHARAMVTFFSRGQELSGSERADWLKSLRDWHEQLFAPATDSRFRQTSARLVPAAFGRMRAPEATAALLAWLSPRQDELTLSALAAISALPRDSLGDEARRDLFRATVLRLVAADRRSDAVAEAAAISLGLASRGMATPDGIWRGEVDNIRRMVSRGQPLFEWITRRPGSASSATSPLDGRPCEPGRDSRSGRRDRDRAEFCALAALIRPELGIEEWNGLRQGFGWRPEELGLIGLAWSTAALRQRDEVANVDRRLAPLADLLRSRDPVPPGWRLAAMLALRSVPEAAALDALIRLEPEPADHPLFVTAARSLFDAPFQPTPVLIQRLAGMNPATRLEVLSEFSRAAGRVTSDQSVAASRTAPLMPLLSQLRVNPAGAAAAVEVMRLWYRFEPAAVLAAIEDGDGYRSLAVAASRLAERSEQLGEPAAALRDALLAQAWPEDVRALGGNVPLVGVAGLQLRPSLRDRYGKVRVDDNVVLSLGGTDTPAAVAFFHPARGEVRVLRPGEIWLARSGESGSTEDWLFRLPAGAGDVTLRENASVPLTSAERENAPSPPTLQTGTVHRIDRLYATGDAQRPYEGWARLDQLRRGEQVVITTFGLGERVDSMIAIRRGGATLVEDDDGGGGLASRLSWTADSAGSVMVRITNIGREGGFSLIVQRVAPPEVRAER